MKKTPASLLFFFILLFSFIGTVYSQNKKIDSLENVLTNYKKQDSVRVDLLINITSKIQRTNKEKALLYNKEALELSKRLNYLNGEKEGYYYLGVYCIYHTNLDEAQTNFSKAIILSKELNDTISLINCYNAIGSVYSMQSNYSPALLAYQDAIKLMSSIDDPKKHIQVYGNMAGVFGNLKDYNQAMIYTKKSLKIALELKIHSIVVISYNNIGELFKQQDKFEDALDNYNKALDYSLDNNLDESNLLKVYGKLASIYNSLGNYNKALEYINLAEEINNNDFTKLKLIEKKGRIKFNQKKFYEAYRLSLISYDKAVKMGYVNYQASTASLLSQISAELKNYKEAYDYHIIYKTLNDSLLNEKSIKQITTLENNFKYDKEKNVIAKEQEKKDLIQAKEKKYQKHIRNSFIVGFTLLLLLVLIILRSIAQKKKANSILLQQKTEIENQAYQLDYANKELKDLIATKNKFFTIISHDLRNPFNTLLGFSDILLENNKEFDESKREKYLKIINETTNKTYQLLGNLLTWSKSQTGVIQIHLEKFYIHDITNSVIDSAKETAEIKNITITNSIIDSIEINSDKNMLETILRNLLSNAIKYTPKNGEVHVNAIKLNDEPIIEFTIKDTGVGMSNNLLKDIFDITKNTSTKGTENEKGTGLGLVLCKEFIEKLGGTITATSELGKGSLFKFTIPIN